VTDPAGRVLFSAAEESYGSAVRELRDAFSRTLRVERLGPDLGAIAAPDHGGSSQDLVEELAAASRHRPLVFIRHLTVEADLVALPEATDPVAVGNRAGAVADAVHPGDAGCAVQCWVSDPATVTYGSRALFEVVTDALGAHRIRAVRSGAPQVLSCVVTRYGVHLGLNRTDRSLSDWPGGRVRLGRSPEQVSRAEFKLEELFQTCPVPLPERGRAVDLGAAPGGWTRILRQRGLDVVAVDPGELAPSLAADPGVRHAATTVGEFFRSDRSRFDLAVNDLRMDPALSTGVMLDAVDHLAPGAYIVLTLKTGRQRLLDTVRDCLDRLRGPYRVVFARQLYHNRKEVTVLARRR
jgi:23S rRNA (cytidine2498-2'-O)-methyltransferase